MSERNNSQHLQRETEAARVLREQLAALAGDDADTIRDTIEGETTLHELIAKVTADVAADQAHIKGLDAYLKTVEARMKRLQMRVETNRAAILNAMAIAEIKTLPLPVATLTRTPTPAKVQITDETAIPSQYWKRGDPKLDKAGIKIALTAGETISGATLSNGGETLAIRFG